MASEGFAAKAEGHKAKQQKKYWLDLTTVFTDRLGSLDAAFLFGSGDDVW